LARVCTVRPHLSSGEARHPSPRLPNDSSPSAAARFTKVSECLGRVLINAQIAAPGGDRSRGWDGPGAIKVFHCFHQENDGSKCEVAHASLPIRPSKSPADLVLGRVLVPWSGEQMAPKSARFVFAVGMALTILAVMTCATAAPESSVYPIYQPQLLLLY